MNIGVLGTGTVGEAIASALIHKGHHVMLGSRTATNEKGLHWAKKGGRHATNGTFDDAAKTSDLLFNCLNGEHTLNALKTVESTSVSGKILIDLTNPLDFSQCMPPRVLPEFSTTSLGEKIQELHPGAFVVKTLNTINYKLMIDAREVNGGDHHLFLCGNDSIAKNKVMHFLVDNFHWKPNHFVDLGGIQHARTVEAIVPFWVSVWQALGTPLFNFKIVK